MIAALLGQVAQNSVVVDFEPKGVSEDRDRGLLRELADRDWVVVAGLAFEKVIVR